MKLRKLILGIIGLHLLLIVGGFYYINWMFNQQCPPPERPSSVPVKAFWIGGCDGGDWIELVDIKDGKYRFRIYQDWNGELKMDADFKSCNNKISLTYSNWHTKVCCYSQTLDSIVKLSVVERQNNESISYSLESIYPAYGGSDWEVIKEKSLSE